MMHWRPRPIQHGLWELIDPALGDPEAVTAMQQILDLVNGDWAHVETIELNKPLVRRLLTDHRLWTLLPVDAVHRDHRAELRKRHREAAVVQLLLRATASEILQLLGEAGLETRVLKGLATGELDYPSLHLRHTGDVDLALRPADIDEAVGLLKRHGYRDHPTPFSRYLLYGWTLDAPNGVEIDLHSRLFRRSPLGDQLFEHPGESLLMLPAQALPLEQRLVHAAGHFIISPPGKRRMSGLIDVTRIHQNPELDLDEARQFAAALGVESLVGAALRVEAMLSYRTELLVQIDAWKPPDWVERNTRLVPERRFVLDHLARYREVPRGQRLKYLPEWLLPRPEQWELLRASTRRATMRTRRSFKS